MHTSAVLNSQKSLERQSIYLSCALTVSLSYSPDTVFLFFSVFFFLTLMFSVSQTHTDLLTDTHYTERKSIHHSSCQTDSTLFTQFICHSNETAMAFARPSSTISFKWCFTPKGAASEFCFLILLVQFYKLLCLLYLCDICICASRCTV